MRKPIILLCCTAFLFQACDRLKKKKPPVIRDTTITETTSFNNLFFDSSAVNQFLIAYPEYAEYKQQFIDFYTQRNFELAWFDSTGLAEQAHNFYNLQLNYINNIGDSAIYHEAFQKIYDSLNAIQFKPESSNPIVANAELLLTGQFFKYASKVYGGSDIDASELGWFIPRKKINLTALLDTVIGKKVTTPEQYVPLNDQYKKLEALVPIYVSKQKLESTDTILYVAKPLRQGDSADIIVQIKNRLNLLQPDIPLDSSGMFDTSLVRATKRFQRAMGLYVDGAIGNKMIAELNVPLEKRIQQLLVNMERMRWMPPENDSNYIVVNIPEYKMHVYDSGRLAFDMNVIVGSAINSTVIFNGNLKYVVFSPYWNVPESIVKKEIMPAMAKDKNYIAKNEMEITGYAGKIPIVRQKPGIKNSLGLVKFLFPNNYNIYFHDTPNRNLFSQSSRSLSHGCIRLGEPKKFAQYLLREDSAIWSSRKIDSAMHLAKEKWVSLKKPIPVFLVYFTAWVDKNGVLNFRKDIYGHDEKMATKLFSKIDSNMQIIEVYDKASVTDFLKVNVLMNAGNPNYIRPLNNEVEEVFNPEKNKQFKYGKACRWVAKTDDGDLVGRIAAFISSKYINKGTDFVTGSVGFFDCINDQATANLLFDTAKDWLIDCGAEAMDGPVNFGDRDKWWGLMVEGFDREPMYGMSFNPSYYESLFEGYGFRNYYNQYYYYMNVDDPLPTKFPERYEKFSKKPGYAAKHVKLSELDKYAGDFATVYNAAWAQHGEAKEITKEQVVKLFSKMKPIMDERVVWFAYYKEDPIAMFVNLPDLNQYFKHFNGRLGWLEKLHLIWMKWRGTNKQLTGLAFGVVPKYQALGVDSYLIYACGLHLQGKGWYHRYEMGWAGDWNPKMYNIYKSLGGKQSRRMVTYRYIFNDKYPFERHPIMEYK